jgi:uncharacterized protein YndB with AHSA1/START domain
MLRMILFAAPVVVFVPLVVVLLQPAEYRVARTARIAAPPATVFGQVDDLRKFHAWNPWAKLDPAATYTFDGPSRGTGAVSTWSGNGNVGAGRMTIIESRPNELIRMELNFVRPFASTATAEFSFKPEGAGTVVTWSMQGRNTFMGKAIGLVMSLDRMIGGQFDRGLGDLKSMTEGAARAR